MPTMLDNRMAAMSSFGVYGYKARRKLEREKHQKQYESQEARKDVATRLRDSAESRAAQMIQAAGYQQKAASTMAAQQRANLVKSQARTQAATDQAKAYMNPWREAGTDALGKLQAKIAAGPGDMEKSPGYQFRLDEGQKAIERSAAARGGVLSGAATKAALKYGQDFATNDYDNFLRRYYESMEPLERMSGKGMSASQTMGNFGTQGARDMASQGQTATDRIGQATKYGAEAKARGAVSSADIIAQQQQQAAERDYGYAAWKAGDEF